MQSLYITLESAPRLQGLTNYMYEFFRLLPGLMLKNGKPVMSSRHYRLIGELLPTCDPDVQTQKGSNTRMNNYPDRGQTRPRLPKKTLVRGERLQNQKEALKTSVYSQ